MKRVKATTPDKLRYTQVSISSNFKNGGSIDEAINDVAVGVLSVDVFPRMEVYRFDDKFWCRNNRRLYVMKELQKRGHLDEIVVDYVGEKPHNGRYFTTKTAGESIRVRRGRSGIVNVRSGRFRTLNADTLLSSFAFLTLTNDEADNDIILDW
ncbi:uncharacterized protein LOC120343862 [Styela clava]